MRAYPPGSRKGNRFFVCRGTVNGNRYEITTDATNKKDAERAWDQFVKTQEAADALDERRREPRTFREVADVYMDARNVGPNDRRYIDKLCGHLGTVLIDEIRPADIASAANELYPKASNETKNRQVYTPAAAILHFAAENDWRSYIVVRKLKERDPEAKLPPPGYEKLLEHTEGARHLMVLLWISQGWRVTETLGLRGEDIDLENRQIALYIPKSRKWKRMYMHPDVLAFLKTYDTPKGRLFRERDRHAVYRWLRPLCKKLNIAFTPHMARHDFATDLRAKGASGRDLTDLSSWTSPKSTARYASATKEHMRRLIGRRKIGGRSGVRKASA